MEFAIEGSQGDEYRIAFEIGGGRATAFCTCQAGSNRLCCRHRTELMDGEMTNLVSGNAADVVRLKTLLRDTDLAAAYDWVQQAEATATAAKQELEAAKKAMAKVMYGRATDPLPVPRPRPPPAAFRMNDAVIVAQEITSTGIKAGQQGRVIDVQHGKREKFGRSTDLAGHAFQVRFPGGAEIWVKADEITLA